MSLDIIKQDDINQYFETDAISQSYLKKLLLGLENYKRIADKDTLFYEEKEVFILGSAVDNMLTGENDAFAKLYYISTLENKPSEIEMSIAHIVFEKCLENDVIIEDYEFHLSLIKDAIQQEQWFKGKPGDKRIAGLIERSKDYFKELVLSQNKQIITTKEYYKIIDTVNSFKNSIVSKQYFDRDNIINNDNIHMIYQLPIYFKHLNYDCKALLDIVLLYKNDKGKITHAEIIDIKTTSGDIIKFPYSIKKYRYDIQLAWYKLALEYYLKEMFDYEIPINCSFLVENVNHPNEAVKYILSDDYLRIGKEGRPKLFTEFQTTDERYDVTRFYPITYSEIKGYQQLLDDFIFYVNSEFKLDRNIVENNGVFNVDINGAW